jgi:hypothetical protein
MSAEYWVETELCDQCSGPVAILFERDRTNQGTWLQPNLQRICCLNGCSGDGIVDPSSVDRIAREGWAPSDPSIWTGALN